MTDAAQQPWDERSERALLGAVLLDNAVMSGVGLVEPSMFWREQHRWIWRAFQECRRSGLSVDIVSTSNMLRAQGHLERVGGAYLVDLLNAAPTAANARQYAGTVRELWSVRKAAAALDAAKTKLLEQAWSREHRLEAINDAQTAFAAAVDPLRYSDSSRGEHTIAELIDSVVADYHAERSSVSDLRYPFPGCDVIGYPPIATGWVIMAITRHGKTMLVDFLIWHAAIQGIRSHRFDLEDTSRRTVERSIVQHLGQQHVGTEKHFEVRDLRNLLTRQWDGPDAAERWEWLEAHLMAMRELPISYDDTPGMGPEDIRLKVRQKTDEDGVRQFFVDHGLEMRIHGSEYRHGFNRALRTVRDAFKDSDVAGSILAQIKRHMEPLRGDAKLSDALLRRPRLSDALESSAWEQISRSTWSLFRPEVEVSWGRKLIWPHPCEIEQPKATDDAQGGIAYLMCEPTATVLRQPTEVEMGCIHRSRSENRWFHEVWDEISEVESVRHRAELMAMARRTRERFAA